jgi:hypothetical protein
MSVMGTKRSMLTFGKDSSSGSRDMSEKVCFYKPNYYKKPTKTAFLTARSNEIFVFKLYIVLFDIAYKIFPLVSV